MDLLSLVTIAGGLLLYSLISGRLDRPNLVAAHGDRGTSYAQLNKQFEALADFSRSLELAPGSGYPSEHLTYVYSDKAGLYVKLQRYQLAIQDGDKAIELNPQDVVGYFYRGRAGL